MGSTPASVHRLHRGRSYVPGAPSLQVERQEGTFHCQLYCIPLYTIRRYLMHATTVHNSCTSYTHPVHSAHTTVLRGGRIRGHTGKKGRRQLRTDSATQGAIAGTNGSCSPDYRLSMPNRSLTVCLIGALAGTLPRHPASIPLDASSIPATWLLLYVAASPSLHSQTRDKHKTYDSIDLRSLAPQTA